MADTVTQAAPTTPRERVADGAAWLDREHPGWDRLVDLDRLVMQHSCRCVLGQVLGSYYVAEIRLDQAVAMGFDADGARPEGIDANYAALTTEWTRLISARRRACCPCTRVICDPGCVCPSCPHDETEVED